MNLSTSRSPWGILWAAALLSQTTFGAEDWAHWRGHTRRGVVAEKSGWDGEQWISARPSWTVNVGEGASSPLLVGAQVFTLGHQEGREVVTSLEASTGKLNWTGGYAAPKYGRNAVGDEGLYSGPSATPEFDPATRLLYTLGTDGDLRCWDTMNRGAPVWERNLYDDYQMPQRAKVGRSGRRDYGYTAAPVVSGDVLLVEVGAPTGTIIAFEKRTGREAWRSEATSVAGHTGGLSLLTVEGVPCAAAMTFDGLLVVRLDPEQAGKTVATYPWVTDFANNIASPAVHGDCVLITSAYNHQAMCKLRITLQGAEKLWEQPIASKACTPVIHDGKIYLAWSRLRCLDWESGNVIWEGPATGDAGSCVVTADEKLIVWANQGELFLVDIAPRGLAGYRELARLSRLAESDVWPHVVMARQQILCRDRYGKLLRFAASRRE